MQPNAKLDFALEFYYKAYHDRKTNTYKAHFGDVVATNPELQEKALLDEAMLWSEKLHKDGYIDDFLDDDRFYVINFDGMIFHLQGGYTGQLRNAKLKNRRRHLLNIIIAGGTGFAGIYALWQFYKGFVEYFYPCDCY